MARAKGGSVVASTENRSALDDLEWLGIEPDEMTAPVDARRAAEVGEELIAAGRAYPCFCSVAELREMAVNPTGFPEPVVYDQRCRKLSPADRAALTRMGRKARVRVIVPEEPSSLPGVDAPLPRTDFTIVEPDGNPTTILSAVLSARDAQATHILVDGARAHELNHWLCVAEALQWPLPPLHLLPTWLTPEGPPISERSDGLTISALRAQGYHPKALVSAAARVGWDPGQAETIEDMTGSFSLDALGTQTPVLDLPEIRQRNGDTLRAMDEADLVQAIGEHLDRKGYPFTEREPAWQRRFVKAVAPEMQTLSDAEEWATLLLTSTVDYDRETARVLRDPTTQELITEFEKALDQVEADGHDARAWRVVLTDFRREAAAPGRALVTMRIVLTGQREGPGLPPILALLGVEGCRARLEKARRYASA